MKYNYTLHIAGVELPLTCEHDERYVQALSAELTRRIHNLLSSSMSITKTEAALVCALDLLDENCQLRLEKERMEKDAAK